jgi:hypothetical protein
MKSNTDIFREVLSRPLERTVNFSKIRNKDYVSQSGFCYYARDSWQVRFKQYGLYVKLGVLGGEMMSTTGNLPSLWLGRLEGGDENRAPPGWLVRRVLLRAELRNVLQLAQKSLENRSSTLQELLIKLRDGTEIDLIPVLRDLMPNQQLTPELVSNWLHFSMLYLKSASIPCYPNDIDGWKLNLPGVRLKDVAFEYSDTVKEFINSCLLQDATLPQNRNYIHKSNSPKFWNHAKINAAFTSNESIDSNNNLKKSWDKKQILNATLPEYSNTQVRDNYGSRSWKISNKAESKPDNQDLGFNEDAVKHVSDLEFSSLKIVNETNSNLEGGNAIENSQPSRVETLVDDESESNVLQQANCSQIIKEPPHSKLNGTLFATITKADRSYPSPKRMATQEVNHVVSQTSTTHFDANLQYSSTNSVKQNDASCLSHLNEGNGFHEIDQLGSRKLPISVVNFGSNKKLVTERCDSLLPFPEYMEVNNSHSIDCSNRNGKRESLSCQIQNNAENMRRDVNDLEKDSYPDVINFSIHKSHPNEVNISDDKYLCNKRGGEGEEILQCKKGTQISNSPLYSVQNSTVFPATHGLNEVDTRMCSKSYVTDSNKKNFGDKEHSETQPTLETSSITNGSIDTSHTISNPIPSTYESGNTSFEGPTKAYKKSSELNLNLHATTEIDKNRKTVNLAWSDVTGRADDQFQPINQIDVLNLDDVKRHEIKQKNMEAEDEDITATSDNDYENMTIVAGKPSKESADHYEQEVNRIPSLTSVIEKVEAPDFVSDFLSKHECTLRPSMDDSQITQEETGFDLFRVTQNKKHEIDLNSIDMAAEFPFRCAKNLFIQRSRLLGEEDRELSIAEVVIESGKLMSDAFSCPTNSEDLKESEATVSFCKVRTPKGTPSNENSKQPDRSSNVSSNMLSSTHIDQEQSRAIVITDSSNHQTAVDISIVLDEAKEKKIETPLLTHHTELRIRGILEASNEKQQKEPFPIAKGIAGKPIESPKKKQQKSSLSNHEGNIDSSISNDTPNVVRRTRASSKKCESITETKISFEALGTKPQEGLVALKSNTRQFKRSKTLLQSYEDITAAVIAFDAARRKVLDVTLKAVPETTDFDVIMNAPRKKQLKGSLLGTIVLEIPEDKRQKSFVSDPEIIGGNLLTTSAKSIAEESIARDAKVEVQLNALSPSQVESSETTTGLETFTEKLYQTSLSNGNLVSDTTTVLGTPPERCQSGLTPNFSVIEGAPLSLDNGTVKRKRVSSLIREAGEVSSISKDTSIAKRLRKSSQSRACVTQTTSSIESPENRQNVSVVSNSPFSPETGIALEAPIGKRIRNARHVREVIPETPNRKAKLNSVQGKTVSTKSFSGSENFDLGQHWTKLNHKMILSDYIYNGNPSLPFGQTIQSALNAVKNELESIELLELPEIAEEEQLYLRALRNRTLLSKAEKAVRESEKVQFQQATHMLNRKKVRRQTKQSAAFQREYDTFVQRPVHFAQPSDDTNDEEAYGKCDPETFCLPTSLELETCDNANIIAPTFRPSNVTDTWRDSNLEDDPQVTGVKGKSPQQQSERRRRKSSRRHQRCSKRGDYLLVEMKHTLQFLEEYNSGYLKCPENVHSKSYDENY